MDELALEYRKDIRDHLTAIGRRKIPMMITAAVLFGIAALVALVLPPVYRSTATILIEEQEIPQDLVRSTISSYADQRIQVISQQVMTRANLMQIVDKYELYPRQRKTDTTEEILERMRKDIKLDLVTSDVTDRRNGNKTTATIAFTLSFDSDVPNKAQRVANELTSLYLNENVQLRQQKAAETSTFLSEEADRLTKHLAEIDARLSTFKTRNSGRLPELAQLNMSMRDRTDSEILDLDRQLGALEEKRFYLESQLALVKPNTPILSISGERIPDPDERLKSLKAQFAGLSGVYSNSHPDMVRMRQQIEALERETGAANDTTEEQKQLVKLRGDLAVLRDRYAEDHPDVTKLKARVSALEARIAEKPAESSSAVERKPENPAYLSFQAQLESLKAEGRALQKQREELKKRMSMLESRIEQTPEVEREYLDLTRDRENSISRYHEIKAKLMEAEIAQQLEKGRKSERFSLIDPPELPEKPRSPNRPAILLIGLVLALGGGAGCVGAMETFDKSVRNQRELSSLLVAPVLSVIPHIVNRDDRRSASQRTWTMRATVVVGAIAALLVFHFFVMPLEVAWYVLLRKLKM